MRTTFFILLLFPVVGFSQSNNEITMTTDYGSDNQELQDILTFEKIDYYHVEFAGTNLKGKNFSLISKEVWNGEVTKIDTIANTAKSERMQAIPNDTLRLRVTGKKTFADELKLLFRFPQFGSERTYKATKSDDYSLRDVGTQLPIEIGKNFYAFAYILPYEQDGWKMWCAVDSSGKDVESWGNEFGIEHYLIFEMKFE